MNKERYFTITIYRDGHKVISDFGTNHGTENQFNFWRGLCEGKPNLTVEKYQLVKCNGAFVKDSEYEILDEFYTKEK